MNQNTYHNQYKGLLQEQYDKAIGEQRAARDFSIATWRKQNPIESEFMSDDQVLAAVKSRNEKLIQGPNANSWQIKFGPNNANSSKNKFGA